ncbi:MAG: hypothetical protein WAM60_17020 [Candidatus Promineifilaceae bacterium]
MICYAINNGPRAVASETRERVLIAIADLGYRPNKHAQSLVREQWGSVAKLLTSATNLLPTELIVRQSCGAMGVES